MKLQICKHLRCHGVAALTKMVLALAEGHTSASQGMHKSGKAQHGLVHLRWGCITCFSTVQPLLISPVEPALLQSAQM